MSPRQFGQLLLRGGCEDAGAHQHGGQTHIARALDIMLDTVTDADDPAGFGIRPTGYRQHVDLAIWLADPVHLTAKLLVDCGDRAKVADQAKASGVTLNLEIINRFESNMLNTAAQGMAYIRDTGASNVFLHLDTFHMNIEEADVGLAIRHASDKIGYVHIGESHRGYLGTGNIDFAAIFDALVAIGWNDYVTFESFSTAIVDKDLSLKTAIWRDLWDDNVALARHARQFIELGLETASRKADLVKLAHLSR